MHEHDQELIAALAEGSLNEAAAAAAGTEIGACPECSRDLELQRIALSALVELPDVYLTATESSQLHANLKRELRLDEPKPATRERSFAWARWLPAVGIAAVFLVAIVSLPRMFGGDSDDAADTTGVALNTTAATEETIAESAPLREDDTAADSAESMAGSVEEAQTATTEAMAAAETTTTAATDVGSDELLDGSGMLPMLGDIADLDRLVLLDQLVAEGEELRAMSLEVREADAFIDGCLETTTAEIADTLGLPELSDPILLGWVFDESGEEFLLVAYVPESVEDTLFVTQRSFVCEVANSLFEP